MTSCKSNQQYIYSKLEDHAQPKPLYADLFVGNQISDCAFLLGEQLPGVVHQDRHSDLTDRDNGHQDGFTWSIYFFHCTFLTWGIML